MTDEGLNEKEQVKIIYDQVIDAIQYTKDQQWKLVYYCLVLLGAIYIKGDAGSLSTYYFLTSGNSSSCAKYYDRSLSTQCCQLTYKSNPVLFFPECLCSLNTPAYYMMQSPGSVESWLSRHVFFLFRPSFL